MHRQRIKSDAAKAAYVDAANEPAFRTFLGEFTGLSGTDLDQEISEIASDLVAENAPSHAQSTRSTVPMSRTPRSRRSRIAA